MYTWIYHHTGRSILAAILFHFAANFWGELLTVRGEMVLYRSAWIVVMVIAIVSIWGPQDADTPSGSGRHGLSQYYRWRSSSAPNGVKQRNLTTKLINLCQGRPLLRH